MGVDTKEKRLSFLNFGLPWWSTLPETDGAIDSDDRLHLLHLYSGIAGATPAVADPYGLEFTLTDNRFHYTAPGSRMQFTAPDNHMQFTLPTED